MSAKLVAAAFQHMHSAYDVSAYAVADWRRLDEYVMENSDDRRYRVFVGAASIGSPGIDSAIVTYRRVRYYVYFDTPSGKFVAETNPGS